MNYTAGESFDAVFDRLIYWMKQADCGAAIVYVDGMPDH
jgi:hypothetical protein